MKSERVVELVHELKSESADDWAKAFDGNGTNLLGLGFGVGVESGLGCRQENLERIDAIDIGSDWDKSDHAAAKACCGGVRRVVAHHHSGSGVRGLVADHRIEIHESDLAATHQLSTTALSHASLAGSSAHSLNAAA